MSFAESCTGGLVAHRLTNVPGCSAYYRGAINAYVNEAKERLLGVPAAMLAAHGAVSEEVAGAMAEGARRALGSDLAVGVTGIAGPDGGTAEKPVGTVCFGLAAADHPDRHAPLSAVGQSRVGEALVVADRARLGAAPSGRRPPPRDRSARRRAGRAQAGKCRSRVSRRRPSERWRCFVAVTLGDPTRAAVIEYLERLRATVAGVAWTRPENLHLTLKFLGDVAAARVPSLTERLRLAVAAEPAFTVRVGGVGAFPSLARPQALWVGVGSPRVAALAAAVESACEPRASSPSAVRSART